MSSGRRLGFLAGLLVAIAFAVLPSARADTQTLGLFLNDPGAFDGYTLFAPLFYPETYLIDMEGRPVHTWATGRAVGAYLLEDGTLIEPTVITPQNPDLGAGGFTGAVRRYAWDGTLLWNYQYSTSEHTTHHDIEVLPNGHVLMQTWELKTAEEAIAAGRDPALLSQGNLYDETIIEVAPTGPTTGDIVWKWDAWDHLVQDFDASKANYGTVADHPELMDINFVDSGSGARDWLHANSVSYNPALDQIMVSFRSISEFWVIDHSTTTAEAAGHSGGTSGKGGDILYRWGNPQAYRAGTAVDRQSFYQHDPDWIAPGLPGAGDILFFNNGPRAGGPYSTITEITPPVDGFGNYTLTPGQAYGPTAPVWSYTAPNPTDFYSQFISSAQRLANGNTFIDSGIPGIFFEVQDDGTMVWKYANPVSLLGPLVQGQTAATPYLGVFRAYRYPADYPGLAGQDLTPGDPLETDTDGDGLSDLTETGYYGTDPLLADTDGDHCSDRREVGQNAGQGGLRDPLNPWDYFNPTQDGVNRADDIYAAASRYGVDDDGNPLYDTRFDRSPLPGGYPWQFGPPDGHIRIFEVTAAVMSYGHDCA